MAAGVKSIAIFSRFLQQWGMRQVGPSPGRIENDPYVVVFEYGVEARDRRGDAVLFGEREPFGIGLDAAHQHEVHPARATDFVHQIGADIAGAQNGYLDFRFHIFTTRFC